MKAETAHVAPLSTTPRFLTNVLFVVHLRTLLMSPPGVMVRLPESQGPVAVLWATSSVQIMGFVGTAL